MSQLKGTFTCHPGMRGNDVFVQCGTVSSHSGIFKGSATVYNVNILVSLPPHRWLSVPVFTLWLTWWPPNVADFQGKAQWISENTTTTFHWVVIVSHSNPFEADREADIVYYKCIRSEFAQFCGARCWKSIMILVNVHYINTILRFLLK
jgi:hypothetical protein